MSTGEFTHDVFLSHRSEDKAVVRPLAERVLKATCVRTRNPKREIRNPKQVRMFH